MDTTTVVTTWPGLVQHIFDSVWAQVGAVAVAFLLGWLGMKQPKMLERKTKP